jgi:hypothetical protein
MTDIDVTGLPLPGTKSPYLSDTGDIIIPPDSPAPPPPPGPAVPVPPAPSPGPDRNLARSWGFAALACAIAALVSPVLVPVAAPLFGLCLIIAAVAAATADTVEVARLPAPLRAAAAVVKAAKQVVAGQPGQALATLAAVPPLDWLWLVLAIVAVFFAYKRKRR